MLVTTRCFLESMFRQTLEMKVKGAQAAAIVAGADPNHVRMLGQDVNANLHCMRDGGGRQPVYDQFVYGVFVDREFRLRLPS